MKAGEIEALRKRFKALYPNEPTHEWQPLTDRIRRALSWLDKAAHSKSDSPVRFVELWIALNALYGQQPSADRTKRPTEGTAFARWAEKVAGLDAKGQLLASIDDPVVDSLMRNRFLCSAYWAGDSGYQRSINDDVREKREAVQERRVAAALICVFQRILVLRNQIVHGSAAQNTVRNQDAVQPAIRVLSAMLRVPLCQDG